MHSITLSTIFKSTDSSISIEATGSKRSVCDFEGGQLLIDQFDKVKCAFFRLKDSLYIEFLIDILQPIHHKV